MPYTITVRDNEYCVYRKDSNGKPFGKTLGCHPTKKKAIAQIGAIESSEKREEAGDHICVCPECGAKVTAEIGQKCNATKCPKCGAMMRAEGAPRLSREEASYMVIVEGWLPKGISQNDLDDGDFAWLSNAYKSGKTDDKSKGRKLPYKVHGKVNRAGWKAAWRAAAHPGARHPSFAGGPSQQAVLKKLRAAKPKGIEIDVKNRFTDTEENTPAVLIASERPLEILEETQGGLRVAGVALIDGAISSNRRLYTAEFNDRCMEATNKYMAEGGTVTIFSRHGNAVGRSGQMPTALPIGKVSAPLYRKESEIWYNGFIVDTTEGNDVIKLIKAEVMLATSIRAISYKSRMRRMNGQDVEELIEATIVGIDTTDEAGIRGAGIREVLEEAPQFEEEEDMDYEKITMEELLEHRKDLLDEHAAAVQEAMQVKVDEAEARVAEVEAKLQEKVGEYDTLLEEKGVISEAAEGQVKDLALKLKIAEAANFGGMSEIVLEELTKKVKCEEDIEKYLKEAKDKAMTVILGRASTASAKGQTLFTEEDNEPKLDAVQRGILRFVGREE